MDTTEGGGGVFFANAKKEFPPAASILKRALAARPVSPSMVDDAAR